MNINKNIYSYNQLEILLGGCILEIKNLLLFLLNWNL